VSIFFRHSAPMADAEVLRLEDELRRCIATEEFEMAATLRDALRNRRAELANTQARLQALEAELKALIEAMEFEKAAVVRDAIRDLKEAQGGVSEAEVKQLEADLRRLIAEERYEEAATVRDRLRDATSIIAATSRTPAIGSITAASAEGEPTLADDKAGRNAKGETRTVYVYGCPPELTEGDLRAQFPTATHIHLITREGKSTGTAALRFATVSEAKAFSKQQTVAVLINGRRVRLPMAMGGHRESPEAKAQRIVEEAPRTTYVLGCPSDITEGELMEQFPAAETTQLMFRAGKFTGTAAVIFATAAEAEKAATQRTSEVRGRRVSIQMGGRPESPEEKAQRIAKERTRTVLIIGCPPTTTEEGLWKQFPTAERIRLPAHEGKPTGTAFVCFPTVAGAEEAAGMGAVVVMGKHVRLEMGGCKKTPEKKAPQIAEERTRTVLLDGCPQNTTNSELWGQFPTAEMIMLPMRKGKPTGNAFVCFATVAAAEKAAGRGTVSVMGKHVRMAMRGDTPLTAKRVAEEDADPLAETGAPKTTEGNEGAEEPTAPPRAEHAVGAPPRKRHKRSDVPGP